ncbi:hypothetical protein [Aquimarina algiphila]|uniref:Uncharacterized protein n=1 Tax=Aquimarina algiphila TaxID=2047982 RepID=A0A554VAM9_9FLAO|nr:hypothetical protein [Aquimarina algiphila]TSE03269.1 hypothetical protein FOF46_29660 [Aquimarina algiphila]
MRQIVPFFILCVATLVAIFFNQFQKRRKEKRKQLTFVLSRIDKIKLAVQQFEVLLNLNKGYFSNYNLSQWQ